MAEKNTKSRKKAVNSENSKVSLNLWVDRIVQTDKRLDKSKAPEILVFLKKQGLEDQEEELKIEEAFKRF
jgi:hypothetical protein